MPIPSTSGLVTVFTPASTITFVPASTMGRGHTLRHRKRHCRKSGGTVCNGMGDKNIPPYLPRPVANYKYLPRSVANNYKCHLEDGKTKERIHKNNAFYH